MTISKPSWLRSWLERLNWDIFLLRVYVGDAIESGIDWAIDWVNWAIDLGYLAWDKAAAAWDKAVEEARELGKRLDREVDKLLGKIDAWWDSLGGWWTATYQIVQEWVLGRLGDIKDTLADLAKTLQRLDVAWQDFRRYSLPRLLDLSWVTSFFGQGIATIGDWWLPTRQKLEDTFGAITDSLSSEVNQHTKKLADWGGFFANPFQWLLDRFETWFWGGES